MSKTTQSNEQRYFDALKRIAAYQPPARLLNRSLEDWGLEDGCEALEYAYENVLQEAKQAVKNRRRPSK